jgi:hypothetical protein
MPGRPILRAVAVAASAALLVTALAVPTLAKPTCGGKAATIVGTAKGEVITGTRKSDVIVARGGHDIIRGRGGNDTICGGPGHDKLVGGGGHDLMFGQTGRDRLFGGPGRDRLLGGPANDRFNGGSGNDACLQGSGAGLRVACERPAVQVPPGPPPAPKTLAVAYSDLVADHQFGAGDVLIAKLVDTSLDGVPSVGDTIEMDQYPTWYSASTFYDWGRKSHPVTYVVTATGTMLDVDTLIGRHQWEKSPTLEKYKEYSGSSISLLQDALPGGTTDSIQTTPGSPSEPPYGVGMSRADSTDDRFINVDLLY